MSKASQELLTRLIERKQQVATLQDALLTLKQQQEDLVRQLTESQSVQDSLQTALTETSHSLAELQTQFKGFKEASDALHALDQEAVKQARQQRDTWVLVAGGGGLLAILAAVFAVLK